MKLNLVTIPLATIMIVGCAGITDTGSTVSAQQPTPKTVSAASKAFINTEIEWGGIIARTDNLERTTELEIIAYPLNKRGRPDTGGSSTGRFIATHEGYLESADYAKGRHVTVKGTISGLRTRAVKKSAFDFPALSAKEIQLWPKNSKQSGKPTFHIGIGIGSGGYRHGGIGIGF